MKNYTEKEIEMILQALLMGEPPDEDSEIEKVTTFRQAGVLGCEKGLVIKIGDSEFQISIVRSK